jgi:hypothetical protein
MILEAQKNSAFVTVSFIGGSGLGNQMFQYAAGLGLALNSGASLELDTSAFQRTDYRKYSLDNFQIIENYKKNDLYIKKPLSHRLINKIDKIYALKKVTCLVPQQYREEYFYYNESFFNLKPPVTIEGYFQSPLYFNGHENSLRSHFQMKKPWSNMAEPILYAIRQAILPVSLHIRRGDYLNSDIAKTLSTLPLSYFARAVTLVEALYGKNIHFFIFSDDPDWIEKNFDICKQYTVVRGHPEAPWEDMHLMALCKHHIIANSTFSWWGAWLNPSENKTVIAPRQWFTPHQQRLQNITDLFPKDWLLG